MDLIFTHIYEHARAKMDLSRDEYALCNYISVWSSHPGAWRPGWCDRTLKQKAAFLGITERGVTKMQNRLIELNLLQKDSMTSHVKTTVAWFETVNAAKMAEQSSALPTEQSSAQQGTKFRRHREQSSVDAGNKVPPHSNTNIPIENNDFIVIDGDAEIISPVDVVVNHLNATLRPIRPFSAKTKKTIESVNARLREKFTVDDICLVIEYKTAEWLGDAKMEQYIRPETLFGTGKFEGYLVAATNWQAKGKPKFSNSKNGHNGTNGHHRTANVDSDATAGAFADY